MSLSIETPAKGTRLRLERHDPDMQVEQALRSTARWLHEYLDITSVKRRTFTDAFLAVIREEEPKRFVVDSTDPQQAIIFDGSHNGRHAYLNKVADRVGLPRIVIPRNVALWISTGENVEAYVYVNGKQEEQRYLYPRFFLEEKPERPTEKVVTMSVPLAPVSWIRRIFRR